MLAYVCVMYKPFFLSYDDSSLNVVGLLLWCSDLKSENYGF